jgi:hypothetical protein
LTLQTPHFPHEMSAGRAAARACAAPGNRAFTMIARAIQATRLGVGMP